MKEKFYYIRDGEEHKPYVTIAIVYEGETLLARGIAICSYLDNPEKKIGRAMAKGRAMKALINQKDDLPIYRFYYVGIDFKSMYRPKPTKFEMKLMGLTNKAA